jgi:hypothetical protein
VSGPAANIDHIAIRVNDLDASTMFYWTIAEAVGLTLRRQTVDRVEFSLDESERSLIVLAGEPTQNVRIAFSGNDEEVRRFHAGAIAAGTAAKASRVSARAITRATTPRSCSTPTATTSKSSSTTTKLIVLCEVWKFSPARRSEPNSLW